MNIAFLGDDQYSAIILKNLLSFCQPPTTNHQLLIVITTRPKPKGRKKLIEPNPVEKLANEHKIKVLYYNNNQEELSKLIQYLKNEKVELGVLTSFGHILPGNFLNTFPHGIINIHPSLLPQYRGSAPIQHTLAMGDKLSGVTLFTLTEKIDDGQILAQHQRSVEPNDTTLTLSSKLFTKGAELLTQILDNDLQPLSFTKSTTPKKLIYTRIFSRQDGFIEWDNFLLMLENKPVTKTDNKLLNFRLKHNPSDSKDILYDLHRALHPWPGIWTESPTKKGVKRLKITQIKPSLLIHIEGKPNPISWQEFAKHYLP